ncbi:MAG: hypothetical protein IJC26_00590 [Clostridia bacterium]|nr:hypothetical protein [Clostridia bacterium]
MSDQLFAGFAKAKVCPPMGINVPGYFKKRWSDGFITDLYLNATAFQCGDSRAIIFSTDAIGIFESAYKAIREKIAERVNIDVNSVYICCIHSHTSFRITNPGADDKSDDAIFMRRIHQEFADLAQFAFEDLKPVEDVKIAKGIAKDVGFIRRYRLKDGSCKTNPATGNPDLVAWDGVQDESLQLVRVVRENADEILFVNFGTHPDVIGGTKYCADWPGFTRDFLSGALGGHAEVMMIVGAQGDSNHVNRFLPKGVALQKLDRAKQMARILAGEALKIYDDAVSVPFNKITFANKIIEVGTNPFDPADIPEAKEIHALYLECQDNSNPVFKKYKLNVPEALRIVRLLNGPDKFFLQVSALQIGNIAFVGFPGEPFTEIGLKVKEASKMDMTVCSCITNGGQGYFPTAAAFAEKGYERSTSPFAHDVAQKLIDAALELIDEMDLITEE